MTVVPLKSNKLPDDPICETPTMQRVTQLLELCHQRGAMGRIIGAPGVGKTVALGRFCKAIPYPEQAHIVTASSATGTSMLEFLNSVAEGMRESRYGTANQTRERIRSRLFQTKSITLIIDEAQKLNAVNVELLCEFHDEAQCGIVLCGNPDISS